MLTEYDKHILQIHVAGVQAVRHQFFHDQKRRSRWILRQWCSAQCDETNRINMICMFEANKANGALHLGYISVA